MIRDTGVRIRAPRGAAVVGYPRVVRGKPVALWSAMTAGIFARSAALATVATALGGCLYLDPINERPSAETVSYTHLTLPTKRIV